MDANTELTILYLVAIFGSVTSLVGIYFATSKSSAAEFLGSLFAFSLLAFSCATFMK